MRLSPIRRRGVVDKVVLSPRALEDLQSIFLYVAKAAGIPTAEGYERRIREACLTLRDFPLRGMPREDIAPGIRTLPFERRGVIAYSAQPGSVRILRILHGGRDLGLAFGED
jgi:toxin ParE1/3/4